VAGTVVEHFAKLDETVQVGKALFSVDDSKAPELSQKVGSTPASASPVSVPAASSVNEATKATTDRKPLIRFLGKRSLLSHTSSHFEVPSSTFSPVLSDVPSSADVLSFQHVKKIPLKPAEIAAINSGIAFL
jgi:pyruvate/2-oxoglutarate dehydrogenase complex dihydrolipoamide acyltransferase (E2) component